MGKRELLIAIAFVAVGVVAWQFTAPPSNGGGGFSLRDWWNRARAEIREDAERASLTMTGAIPLGDAAELRLVELPRGTTVVGEARDDVAWELAVESTGPTVEDARRYAERVVLTPDAVGGILALKIEYPPEARQTARLALRVPDRLALRAQSMRTIEVTGLAAVHLDGVSGDAVLRETRGAVTGTHGAGDLTVSGAASVKLTLLPNSDATIDRVSGGVAIDARNGEVTIADTAGVLEITGLNQEIAIARHDGPVRVGGSGGLVELDGPTAESRIDMRRAEIVVTLRAPVPLALLTTDEPLRLLIAGTPAIAIDAVATRARIDADDFGLTPESSGADARLAHVFAPGAAARVSLRNLRASIVIGKVK